MNAFRVTPAEGHSASESTLVYLYGAKAPLNPEPLLQQIRLAHQYQNKLVEIERTRREARDTYMATVLPAEKLAREAELVRLIEGERVEVRAQRKAKRGTTKMGAEARVRVSEWKTELKALRAELKTVRGQVREAERGQEDSPLALIASTTNHAIKEARAGCGVYWGTYLLVERAMDLARRSVTPPRFKRSDGSGQIGVQLQRTVEGAHRAGLTVDAMTGGGDPRLQVLEVRGTDWRPGGPSPNLSNWRILRIRIGSEGRAPIWAEVPFKFSRPLPTNAVVTWATVQRRRVGTTFTWHVQFTLGLPAPVESIVHPAPSQACGIDIGWRERPLGLRVAYLEGREPEELFIPNATLDRFEKANQIRAGRDKDLDRIKLALLAWLAGNSCPDLLREACVHLSQWRSPSRLARVVLRWRGGRFAGDEEVFPVIEAWRKQDRHLAEMEAHIRLRAQNQRLDLYRNWALKVCRKYGRITLEGRSQETKLMDLRPLVELPNEESGKDPLHQVARRNRFWAACSILRICLQQAAVKTGTTLSVAPATNTTQTCHVCGTLGNVNVEPLSVGCIACHEQHDQDSRAAHNLLREGEVQRELQEALAR